MPKWFKEKKKPLVLTFPFCIPASTRGSWAVDFLSSVLPGPLLRRTLEPGAAPSLRTPRFWQMSAGSENIHFPLLCSDTHCIRRSQDLAQMET